AARQGHPEARQRLLEALTPLCWSLTAPPHSDPTPAQLDAYRGPRLGPAYISLANAVDILCSPAETMPDDPSAYVINAVKRGITEAASYDRRVYGPPPRTERRHRKADKHIPKRETLMNHPTKDTAWVHEDYMHIEETLNRTERLVVRLWLSN